MLTTQEKIEGYENYRRDILTTNPRPKWIIVHMESLWMDITQAGYLPIIKTGGGMMIWKSPTGEFVSRNGTHTRGEVVKRLWRAGISLRYAERVLEAARS